ncbi:MAG: glycosyltransferase family 4 protein [Nanoarchaeota archaeon]|nr:glycosyltransferase family 4 protein [Nanoarchaeota archaeon]
MHITISVPGRFHGFDLAREMERRGHLEQLITSYPKFETAKYEIPKEKIRSIVVKEVIQRIWKQIPLLRGGYDPYLVAELYDRLAARRVPRSDLVVAFSGFALHTIRKAKQKGMKTIVERGSSHIEYQRDVLREEYETYGLPGAPKDLPRPKIIEKELKEYAEADKIAIPSTFVKRTFIEKGIPEEKLVINPYGVDLSSFRKIPKTDDVFRVIFAGGMSLRKGVHYLLRGFAELDLPNSELVLMGGMNDEIKPFFKKYDGHYRYIGHVPQKELYRYYSQGSVFAILSLEEGLALVQPQAMACELPLICTPNTGGEELIRDGREGFIIPIRNVDALKEKLTYLYEHPDICREMGHRARERVRQGFTWRDYGERAEGIYENIIFGNKL